jgi:hypothetical protein
VKQTLGSPQKGGVCASFVAPYMCSMYAGVASSTYVFCRQCLMLKCEVRARPVHVQGPYSLCAGIGPMHIYVAGCSVADTYVLGRFVAAVK